MTSLLLALLLTQTPPKTHSRPGQAAPYVLNIQGNASGTPIPVTGSFSSSGAGDTVGGTATYDSNSDCGSVATAGQTGIGFILQAGTLAATLTPSVSVDSTNGTNGTWVATSFVDIDGNTASTLVVTNPNAATARGIKAIAGTRYAKVCTTAFTAGSTTGNLVASTPLPPPPAAGADVTDRAARLLGVLSAGDNDVGNVDVEFAGSAAATNNGAASATTQRVTIANDSTGVIGVTNVAEANAVAVRCVSTDGTTFEACGGSGGGSGGTQYDEDTASQAADDITMAGVVRVDSPGTLAGTDGDRTQLQVNAAGALRVDGSAATQPVSGTVTVTDGAGAMNVIVDSSALPSGASTAAKQPALGTAGTASADVITVQGAASMTALQVADNGGSLTVDGTVTVTDGAGALNVIVDSITAGNNNIGDVDVASIAAGNNNIGDVDVASLPSVTIGTFPDNEPINVAQMNGVAVTMGNGGSGTGVQRVTIASDSTGTTIATQATAASLNVRPDTSGATGAAPPARADYIGGLQSGATGGLLGGITVCDTHVPINISTATTTLIVTGVSGRHVRICGINLVAGGADNVAIITGTGATCGTSTAGVNGGTTAASGWNFAANGGIAQGSGLGEIMRTETTGDSICIVTSAAVQLSGAMSVAIH